MRKSGAIFCMLFSRAVIDLQFVSDNRLLLNVFSAQCRLYHDNSAAVNMGTG